VQRDHRLPGADVALEQPLHGHLAAEVAVDLLDRPLLVLGEPERERGPVALAQLAGRAEHWGCLALAFPRPPRQAELQQEELVEREATAPGLCVLERPRPV